MFFFFVYRNMKIFPFWKSAFLFYANVLFSFSLLRQCVVHLFYVRNPSIFVVVVFSLLCPSILVACTRVYKTLCLSVGRSVGRSVRYIYFRSRILLFRGLQRLITAPAQPHATKIAVYTALFCYKGLSF